jgi:uncharacterized protein YicC (UPF0701 family)
VRYPYDKTRRRNITDTYGSIRLDADPDDVKAYIKISQKYRHRIIEDLFTVDDLVHIRSWLLENGDPAARARRQARDARVERAVLERLRASAEAEGNPLAQVVTLLPAAGQMLRKLAEDCRARKQEPWELLRKPYMEVYDAIKQFELAAKEAGVTKKRSKSPDAPSA